MSRETTAQKSARYLAEARLTVLWVNGDQVAATCRGDGEVYQLGHHPKRGWWCECAARADCCHLKALRLVTIRRSA